MRNLLLVLVFAIAFDTLSGQSYFLNGSAVYLGNDCYQLTPALGTMNGPHWEQ